jgi:peroxiredoxin
LVYVMQVWWHIPMPTVQWKTQDYRQRNCPKHVEFLDKKIFLEISASVCFIKKKFVTMHGHMNVKLKSLFSVEDVCNTLIRNVDIHR